MKSRHGCFEWYELLTMDTPAARDFYTKLIGWSMMEWNELEEPYAMWVAGERPIGGLMELPDEAKACGAPPHWQAYVGVDDVDATTQRAKELGAKIFVEPQDIPKVGRFSIFADPQGAVISPFKSFESAADTPEGMPLMHFSWNELAAGKLESAWAFYSEIFGWTVFEDMDMGEAGEYRIYGRKGGAPLGGFYTKPSEIPGPPFWLHYITVQDVHEAAPQVEGLGGKILNGPMEVPGGGSILQCMDPQGAAFALYSEGPQS